MAINRYYPAFLDLNDRYCVVVGGGTVAERKVVKLLASGARVSVVSPELTKQLALLKNDKKIKHISRKYRSIDIEDAFVVVAATNSGVLNERIAKDSSDKLVNVADRPELSSFIVPSVISRSPLLIAVSTSGVSPAMAMTIRRELERLYPPSVGRYLRRLSLLRKEAIRQINDPKERAKFLRSLAGQDVLDILRKKKG